MDKEVKKVRTLLKIKPSKYECDGAIKDFKKYWHKVFDEIHSTISSPSEVSESRRILEALPNDLYQKVCDTLNMPIISQKGDERKQSEEKVPRRLKKAPMLSFRKTLYIDREMDSDTDVEYSGSDEEEPNIYRELLQKPVREQITWKTHFLQPEREDEKSLLTKSDDITNRIATEFCTYMTQLGGNQQSQLFTPEAIKELFQIEFDTHIARGLKVVPKEIPAVIDKIANIVGNPEKSQLAALEREINKDIIVERRPDITKAFGTSIPHKEQWRRPRNETKKMWRSARHVPKDLVTLKTVWEGITDLGSVHEYCRWMIDHPEHRRAPYLRSIGMFDLAVLEARKTLELKPSNILLPPSNDDAPEPIDQIRKRLSQLADPAD